MPGFINSIQHCNGGSDQCYKATNDRKEEGERFILERGSKMSI